MCCARRPKNEVGSHAMIKYIGDEPCNHKHRMRQLCLMPGIMGAAPCAGYYGCQVNELVSICERHNKPQPNLNQRMIILCDYAFQLFRNDYPVKQLVPMTQEECIREASPNRRTRMRKAYENLNSNGPHRLWNRHHGFLKWEAYEDDVFDPLEDKAPRLIQHRSDEFCYELARYMKPLEKYILYKVKGKYVKPINRVFTKGLNSFQVGSNLAKAWFSLADPVAVELDFSKFDSSIRDHMFRMFLKYAKDCYRHDRSFRDMVDSVRKSRGWTVNQILYEMVATLLSGDYWTSLVGNVMNYSFQRAFLEYHRALGNPKINGDDGVLFMERKEFLKCNFEFFEWLGMSIKVIVKYDISEIDFCQCRPMRVGGLWRMVRNPGRVVARCCYTTKEYPNKSGYRKLQGAVAMGEMHCNSGVPIISVFAERMFKSVDGEYSQALYDEYMARRGGEKQLDLPITMESRVDFFCSFGIPVFEQLRIERWLRTVELLNIARP